jgi:hypothetical protein
LVVILLNSRLQKCARAIPAISLEGASSGFAGRQANFESATGARLALSLDAAAVRVHNSPADCQPQPGFALDSGARFIDTIKPFEDMRQVFRRYSDTSICDRQNSGTVLHADAESNLPFFAVKVDRIRNQVSDHLPHPFGVPFAFNILQIATYLHATFNCQGFHEFDAITDDA